MCEHAVLSKDAVLSEDAVLFKHIMLRKRTDSAGRQDAMSARVATPQQNRERSLPKFGSVDNVAESRIGDKIDDLMISCGHRNYVLRDILAIELLFAPNAQTATRAPVCIFKN